MGRHDEPMIELTKRQKYIKEKYFRLNSRNPRNHSPISDKRLVFNPYSLDKIIDMIINILEKENEGEINWEKNT